VNCLSKKRLYELAKELGLSSKELISKAKEANIIVNNHMSNIESHEEKIIRDMFAKKNDIKSGSKENTINSPDSVKMKETVKNNVRDTINEDFDTEFNNKKLAKKSKKVVSNKRNESNAKKHHNRNDKRKDKSQSIPVSKDENTAPKKPIKIGNTISVKDLSEKTGKTVAEIIKKLLLLGVVATINQDLDYDTAALIAEEFGIKIEKAIDKDDEELLLNDVEDREEDLKPRPPVVTIMGHVDHGKTSLLDAIRQTNVIATEAGGITQHIGAYMVNVEGRKIAFLDTPGHEAFTAMRARGAKVTDIAILVVAADDGVMPQTVEAINHAKAANVTIIVAINKIDKPGANPDRVKQELTEHGLLPEDWGGDTICVPVSAKKKIGIENLLEMVLLVAEMQELKANPNRKAKGTVIEAKLDKNRGPVATVLVQNGTLNIGDFFVVGNTHGKVRTMIDEKGKNIKKAGPSTPVEITGLSEVPDAGDIFIAVEDEKIAKQISDKRKEKYREEHLQSSQKISLDDLFSQIQAGKVKELNLIVKADVQGSVEAVKQSLERLSNDEVKIKAIHGGVGAITETDVMFASASNAIIIGFNVRPQPAAITLAEKDKVDIRLYRVIYDAIEDIESAMKGMLEPEYKEVVLGHAEVRAIFKASSIGTIAGCYVTDGKINRNNDIRVVRDGVVIHEGKISSLKRFKDDAKEVNTGFECGISLEKFNDIKEGDIIESFTMEAVPRK
jgi:translation initiation factor IF-2